MINEAEDQDPEVTARVAEYYCETCWYIYDPALGDLEYGVEPGTAFEDLPQQWRCPDCGRGKEAFAPHER